LDNQNNKIFELADRLRELREEKEAQSPVFHFPYRKARRFMCRSVTTMAKTRTQGKS
jgi:hypothetical protein